MRSWFSSRKFRAAAASVAGLALLGTATLGTTAAQAESDSDKPILLKGSTTASYFWDDGSGRAGDTGMPAGGKPMQKGLAASPSWPLHTEGYVIYKGKKAPFFVGDRGPGAPSSEGIMLDLDSKTFAALTGGRFNSDTLMVEGNGGQGHIKLDYVITKWGPGNGKKNYPVPFSTGAYAEHDSNPAKPVRTVADVKAAKAKAAEAKAEKAKAQKAKAAKQEAAKAKRADEAAKAKAERQAEDNERAAADNRSGRGTDRDATPAQPNNGSNDQQKESAAAIAPAAEQGTDPSAFVALALLVLGVGAFYLNRYVRRRPAEDTDKQ